MTEKEFLENYNANDYEHPSVAVDVVILALDKDFKLNVLLADRDQQPFAGLKQLPGGFVSMDTALEKCAIEKVNEKTGLTVNYVEQLYTYGAINRDPRTRVISIVYFAILPQGSVERTQDCLTDGAHWYNRKDLTVNDFAFDHFDILNDAISRIAGQVEYKDVAFGFLKSAGCFTLFEMNKVYEALLGKSIGLANFRRDFLKRYDGAVEKSEATSTEFSKRPSAIYYYDVYTEQ